MPLYEHVFLARQDISTQQVEALTKEFSAAIEEGGGKVGKTEYWGLKTLAYKVKKSRKAHYTLLNLNSPPAAVAEMERRMGLHSDVIRFMTVRVEQLETEPSAQMRKSDRDERGERGERGGFRGERGGFRGSERGGPRGGYRGERGGDRGAERGSEGGSTFRSRSGDGGSPRGPRPTRGESGSSSGSTPAEES
jgi:small subunit ribosomal protein S6